MQLIYEVSVGGLFLYYIGLASKAERTNGLRNEC